MATANFTLLYLLQLLTSISGKIPKAWALFMALYELFADEIAATMPPDDGLELVELSAEEQRLVGELTQALTTDGLVQPQFDLARLRRFVKFVNEARNSDLGKLLIGIFTRLAAGS